MIKQILIIISCLSFSGVFETPMNKQQVSSINNYVCENLEYGNDSIHDTYVLCLLNPDGTTEDLTFKNNKNVYKNVIEQPRTNWNMVCRDYVYGGLTFSEFDPENYACRTNIEDDSIAGLISDRQIDSNSVSNRGEVTNTDVWPYRATGFLNMIYYVCNNDTHETDTRTFIGSAFLLGPNLIATCGHCIYSDQTDSYVDGNGVTHSEYNDNIYNPTFADVLVFSAAKNQNYLPYSSIIITKAYLENYYYTSMQKDWACCVLGANVGNSTGYYDKIANFYEEDYGVESFGYPSTSNGKMFETSSTMFEFESNGWYYRTYLTLNGGHSGGPMFVQVDNTRYVCGIASYTSGSYSGGIRIDAFMYHFLNSFISSRHIDYPSLSIIGKNGNKWSIKVTNLCSEGAEIKYNTKMCFANDAQNWTNLSNIDSVSLSSGGDTTVDVQENWFATHITFSLTTDVGYRWITYGYNLNSANYTMTSGHNKISL